MENEQENRINNDDITKVVELNRFLKSFSIHYQILLDRYAKYKELDKLDNDNLDVGTYFDIIIVQLRALCLENSSNKNNYTIQTLFRKFNKPEYADRIDAMLDQEFLPASKKADNMPFTVRDALKTLADKFICHYDNFEKKRDEWAFGLVIEKKLMDNYWEPNLETIMDEIIDCFYEAFHIGSIV